MYRKYLIYIIVVGLMINCFGCNNPQDKSYKSNEIKKELTLEEKISGIYIINSQKREGKNLYKFFGLKEQPKGYKFVMNIDAVNLKANGRYVYDDKIYEMNLEKMDELKYNLVYNNNKKICFINVKDDIVQIQLNRLIKNSSIREGDLVKYYTTIDEAIKICKEDEKFMKEINEYK